MLEQKYNNLHRTSVKMADVFLCYGAEMLLFLYPFLGGEKHGKPYSGNYRRNRW